MQLIIIAVIAIIVIAMLSRRKYAALSSKEQEDSSQLNIVDKDYQFNRPLDAIKCPYCTHAFERPPSRSRDCPNCKKRIIRRIIDKQAALLTEEDAAQLDEFKTKQRVLKEILAAIGNFYPLPDHIFRDHERQLIQTQGKPANPEDIFWSICNLRLQKEAKRNDFDTLASIYWEMAMFLYKRNKDCSQLQREYFVNKARALRKEAAKTKREFDMISDGLELYPSVECAGASKIIKRTYSFSEFIKNSPLPNSECDRGWCNCSINISYPENS